MKSVCMCDAQLTSVECEEGYRAATKRTGGC